MYELVQVAPHTYYIQSPAKIGLVVLDETSVCLIDSGNDKSAGRKIRQILDANHWQLKAIYNEQTGHKMMMFHLEDAAAVEIAVMGDGESLL